MYLKNLLNHVISNRPFTIIKLFYYFIIRIKKYKGNNTSCVWSYAIYEVGT